MMRTVSRAIALLLVLGMPLCAAAADGLQEIVLFNSGEGGYDRYRIPAVTTFSDGTVLAFCEGRVKRSGLTGNIDIVLRRSLDGGKSWQPLQVVADLGPHTCGNPCPTIDRKTGVIWLPFTRSNGDDTEEEIVAGPIDRHTRVFLTKSTDQGRTWAKPVEISSSTRKPNWTWYGTGPGIGLQLASGRLLIPSYHAVLETKMYRTHIIFSDDHGTTWELGGVVADDTSEPQVVVETDGTLHMNARTIKGPALRTISTSFDDGQTWTKPIADKNLWEPRCQGTIYRLSRQAPDRKSQWLFTNPAGPKRERVTVRLSLDEGRSWPVQRLLHKGPSAYTSIVELSDGSIGCLYERWENPQYYQEISFATFDLDWLHGGNETPGE
jgi:sialidase-1